MRLAGSVALNVSRKEYAARLRARRGLPVRLMGSTARTELAPSRPKLATDSPADFKKLRRFKAVIMTGNLAIRRASGRKIAGFFHETGLALDDSLPRLRTPPFRGRTATK